MAFSIVPSRVETPGSEFARSILSITDGPREHAILAQFINGNIPEFMRTPTMIDLHVDGHTATIGVLPDYLCIGTNTDFLRIPMNPMTAQRIADLFGGVLPSRRIVDAIWRFASVKLEPIRLSPSGAMLSTQYFIDHNALIETARASRLLGALVAGVKKDIVLSPMLRLRPDRVAIYGWHKLDGEPIQRLNVLSHSNVYADYSHGIRLVDATVIVDGTAMRYADVLRHPQLSKLVSDEGPSDVARQPTS